MTRPTADRRPPVKGDGTSIEPIPAVLSLRDQRLKRGFDLVVGLTGLAMSSPVMVVGVLAATIDTREWGIFSQRRIGRYGEPFHVYKVRSMRSSTVHTTTVTASGDPRITKLGKALRAFKVDELPQLINVVKGDMSVVGPRPDVPGWADQLTGPDRVVLSVRPGITSRASLTFRHEEAMLTRVKDAEEYNREVIWPEKVRLNREYVESWTLGADIKCLLDTARSVFSREL